MLLYSYMPMLNSFFGLTKYLTEDKICLVVEY